jgi:hypothetical protein
MERGAPVGGGAREEPQAGTPFLLEQLQPVQFLIPLGPCQKVDLFPLPRHPKE